MRNLTLITLLLGATTAGFSAAIPPDSSRNDLLNGKYWVRQVIVNYDSSLTRPTSPENFQQATTITGALTFDGKGNYTFSGTQYAGQFLILGKATAVARKGTYRVGSSGMASMDSLQPASIGTTMEYGGVGSNGIFVASSTNFHDLMVAIPAGAKILTNADLKGSFWVSHLDYPQATLNSARNSQFQVNANGAGGFSAVTVSGHDAKQSDKALSQPVSGASYSFASDGTASVVFPAPAGVATSSALFTGTKTMFVSADGNYLLGGDPAGYDIFFGLRTAAAGTDPNTAFFGVYYYSDLDGDGSDPTAISFESQSGSINAFQNLRLYIHSRIYPFDNGFGNYDYSFTHTSADGPGKTVNADGSFGDAYTRYVLSADGSTVAAVGLSTEHSLLVGVKAPAAPSSAVFLNPLAVLNAATFAPVTNPISPGELITLFGSNLSPSTTTASTYPFPTSLSGVQVLINGQPSPVYAVSPGQLSAIVPYATGFSLIDDATYAQVQVVNNGKASNIVTMRASVCAPGIFAIGSTGSGYGAVLHANYQVVSPTNPAKPGEVVLVFGTGLGPVKPAISDGAPGPSSPLSYTSYPFVVFFGSEAVTPIFAGVAPGLAGLYQINVQVPKDLTTGEYDLTVASNLGGGDCETSLVVIPVKQ